MSEERPRAGWAATAAAGLIIGVVEAVLAVAFAAFVFGGLLVGNLADGIGLYLAAAALTLGILAWRAGSRGVVGSVQDAAVAVLSGVAAVTAAKAAQLAQVAAQTAIGEYEKPDVFLTVIAATLIVTILTGVVFLLLQRYRFGNLVRFVPYPVVGGFLAGTGWLLLKGGIYVASGVIPALRTVTLMIGDYVRLRWGPALLFGVLMLIAVRKLNRPLVIPTVLGIGVVAFVVGMLVTGSSIESAKTGGWMLGPFESAQLWQPWTLRALTGADWPSVLAQWAGIAIAVFVAVAAMLFNVSGSEVVLDRDLDHNEELRDAGVLNVISGALGGIPAFHALSLTALARRMSVSARTAGLVATLVPLAAVIFGAKVIELIPRMIVGGVLVFLGLAFLVEWVWDKRRSLPRFEYLVVLLILAAIIAWGFLPGVALGMALAVVLFAFSYGQIELVREAAFGDTYHSNVQRPAAEREALRALGDRVQILRVNGFVFFGSTHGLLERIRERVEASPPRFLVFDLRRASGVDSSAAASFLKSVRLAQANGFEIVFAGASATVRDQLALGGVVASEGVVAFEPDLDRALQRCEDSLLAELQTASATSEGRPAQAPAGLPPNLSGYLERMPLEAGTVLIRQDESPGDVFVLESGKLSVEMVTAEGTRVRLSELRPGVVVGEIALYTGIPRTADVVAETPSVVLRLSRESIRRMEAAEPELAATLHRWLAETLAGRLTETAKAFDALFD